MAQGFTNRVLLLVVVTSPLPSDNYSGANMIQRRSQPQFDSSQIAYRAEELISAASNRYKITVQVANRAKKRHRYEAENMDDPNIKPVMRAIIEMSDELTQPEILGD
jgi:DNA-directed RNA polymerase subunit omega